MSQDFNGLIKGMIVTKKPGGTEFIGQIVNLYSLPNGDSRMDVRCIAPGARNLIHIYRPDQFRLATSKEIQSIKIMLDIWKEYHEE